ncbi:TauD/TfdA family dioxygenase [Novosphingobium sp. AP12]|uniref:TauD/TfdA dioxygenase family protein n=1 Tax=Novosphingobium sp. AP12 TaxID=1144305 RepID=UPI000271E6FD|nr:TauD/TfdA family dioxygenase [Novosphingobium sp. AP12]EJL34484.1 putative taurine catabolism dioxygenase [Novosphingobium sp. AP12]
MATSATTFDTATTGLVFRPVQPSHGAEIEGIDLSKPLTDELRAAIRAAVLKYKVVFFRDQSLDDASQAAFAANFGPLYTHPTTRHDTANKEVHAIAAKYDREYEKKLGRKLKAGDAYHTDTSWRLVPTWGAVLRDVNLPEVGGDTIWVDANLAYETLPEELKQRLEGKYVTHDFTDSLELSGHEYPIVAHKVVRTHRETGQKILWVNFQQQPQILGIELAESRELLDEVLRQYKRPDVQARFSWRPGTVAFWDNRAAVHYAVRNYGDFPRELHRILIADEPLWTDL